MFHPSDSGEILEMSRVGFGPGLLVLIDLVSGLGRVQLGSGLGQFQL